MQGVALRKAGGQRQATYGLCLMISCAGAGIRMVDALKDTVIMLLPMLGVLALLIVWPEVALFLPRLISPEFLR
jgi:TRAP-type C4-dicarboxylate transport system permease large subunit